MIETKFREQARRDWPFSEVFYTGSLKNTNLRDGNRLVFIIDLSIITVAITVFTLLYFLMWCILSIAHVSRRDKIYGSAKFNPHEPTVTILIPCRNEEKVVADAITQCLNQSYESLEVIVVAHNCRDKTFEVAKQFECERVHVLKLDTKESGKGLGLNYGLKSAIGDIIVYFDADSLVERDYVKKIVDTIYEGKYDLVQGKILGANPHFNRLCFLQHMENLLFLSFFWGGKQKLNLPCGLGGTGVAIKRSSLEQLGGYRNVLVEDFDLCLRAEMKNMKIAYRHDAIVYDEKVPYFRMIIRQRTRWFAGHLQLANEMIRCPNKLLTLLKKNPVDFLHLLTPFYSLGLWIGVFVGLVSLVINSQLLFQNIWVVYFSVPFSVFLAQTVLLQALFLLVLKKECRTHAEFRRCALNLPLFNVYTLHWFMVFWNALFLRDWERTKMEHGFRGNIYAARLMSRHL